METNTGIAGSAARHAALERAIVELERISAWIPADDISHYQVSRVIKAGKLLDRVLNPTGNGEIGP